MTTEQYNKCIECISDKNLDVFEKYFAEIENKAEQNDQGLNILHWALLKNAGEIVQYILESAKELKLYEQETKEKNVATHFIVSIDCFDIVWPYIKDTKLINHKNIHKQIPLHWYVAHNPWLVIHAIHHGADIKAKTRDGNTFLHTCFHIGYAAAMNEMENRKAEQSK